MVDRESYSLQGSCDSVIKAKDLLLQDGASSFEAIDGGLLHLFTEDPMDDSYYEEFQYQPMSSQSFSSINNTQHYYHDHPLVKVVKINEDIQNQVKLILEVVDSALRHDRLLLQTKATDTLVSSTSGEQSSSRLIWMHGCLIKWVKRLIQLWQDIRSAEAFPMKARMEEYFRSTRSRPVWSLREEDLLASSIRQQNERNMLRSLVDQRRRTGANISLRDRFYAIRNMPAALLEEPLKGLDWNRIADSIRTGGIATARTATECKAHWTVLCHPSVSRSCAEWTREEIDNLARLVEQFGPKGRWSEIAAALGTNRSAWSCLTRYKRTCGSLCKTGKWSRQDDAELLAAVSQVGTNWSEVVDLISSDRSSQQCMHRFVKAINPEKVRGRWTAYEDACLKAAVKLHGSKDWWLVEHYVPRRTDMQCRERWINVLSPDVDSANFSPEEDRILLSAVQRHGQGRWSLIARTYFPRRTDNQCWRRWKKLQASRLPPTASRGRGRRRRSYPSTSRAIVIPRATDTRLRRRPTLE